MKPATTSWGNVADWYDDLVEDSKDTFQEKVILPNLLRLMEIRSGQRVLDVACGQGFFSRAFAREGAKVTGCDISSELIALAKKRTALDASLAKNLEFFVASADQLTRLPKKSIDIATIVLAIQNIENVHEVFRAVSQVLKPGGRLMLVMNHPAFRIPKASSWGYDEKDGVQYRRVDAYLSEAKVKIDMHPGQKQRTNTVSFHRSLQFYIKSFFKAGFAVTRLEEWISHRHGPKGKTFLALEQARKEIPLFLCMEVRAIKE